MNKLMTQYVINAVISFLLDALVVFNIVLL